MYSNPFCADGLDALADRTSVSAGAPRSTFTTVMRFVRYVAGHVLLAELDNGGKRLAERLGASGEVATRRAGPALPGARHKAENRDERGDHARSDSRRSRVHWLRAYAHLSIEMLPR